MTTILKTAQADLIPIAHPNPLQRTITFVFADDQPDGNHRVLDHSEFPNVIRTAIGMPIKMKFDGAGVSEHDGAIPVGAITAMREQELGDGSWQLIAEASLWLDEYPEEVAWLEKAYAENRAPGFSYELVYEDSEHIGGLERIKNVITGAAALVKIPAFGNRTPLLALASLMQNPEHADEIRDLIAEAFDTKAKGGNSMDEKEIEQLQAKAALVEGLQAQVAEAASKDSVIEDLNAQLTAKDTELASANETIATMERDNLLNARVSKYVEAGFTLEADAEKADARKNLFASLNDDQFEAYIADLVAVKPKETQNVAIASLRRTTSTEVPKLEGTGTTDYTSLRAGMKSLARPNSAE